MAFARRKAPLAHAGPAMLAGHRSIERARVRVRSVLAIKFQLPAVRGVA